MPPLTLRAFILGSLLPLAACEGCKTSAPPSTVQQVVAKPSVRLYLLSDVAGALEPCGCVKDQLGGFDRFLALAAKGEADGVPSATLAAGPLFFMDPKLEDDRRGQELSKAQTLAQGLKKAQLLAFAPSVNDHAAGADALNKLTETSGAKPLQASSSVLLHTIGGVRLGVFGLGPDDEASGLEATAKALYEQARAQGAQAVIALVSVGRGPAKRVADAVPELTAVLVGSARASGDGNTSTPLGERVGEVLIAETGNHLQTVAVLELTVRDDGRVFADASNLDDKAPRRALTSRIEEAQRKLDKASVGDQPALREQLKALRNERAALDVAKAPAQGNFFRYRTVEVREELGQDPFAVELFSAYYKQINDANREAFKDRAPRPAEAGEASYVGVERCASCHAAAKAVWDKTAHARAYATLSDQNKEFNLDCVSCHVTGYERPGGSTVTHVKGLTNVQCEVCHGPGSLHAANPSKVAIEKPRPTLDACASCHHPPHVHSFDAGSKVQLILGPGHGRPL